MVRRPPSDRDSVSSGRTSVGGASVGGVPLDRFGGGEIHHHGGHFAHGGGLGQSGVNIISGVNNTTCQCTDISAQYHYEQRTTEHHYEQHVVDGGSSRPTTRSRHSSSSSSSSSDEER